MAVEPVVSRVNRDSEGFSAMIPLPDCQNFRKLKLNA